MKVTVLSFGALKDVVGSAHRVLELPAHATAGDAVRAVFRDDEVMNRWLNRLMVAVNSEQSGLDCLIADGDEVALMPPVSGG